MSGVRRVSPDAIEGGWVARWLVPLVLFVAGMALVVLPPMGGMTSFPGDLRDGRFNGAILEHFYLWLTGHQASLISPSFYYPMPGVLTFSDNLWGTAWIYSLFRASGWDRYESFDLWFLTGAALNYVVSWWVFRRLRFSGTASAVAAFCFSFAMPVVVKFVHAQLLYRALVPVGLLCWQRFHETASWRWLGLLALATVGQFYVSIYLGYFTVLFIVAWAAMQGVIEGWQPWARFAPWRHWSHRGGRSDLVAAAIMLLVAALAFAWLMLPYIRFAALYGFGRSPGQIEAMLPRPQSYFLADQSIFWRPLSVHVGEGTPARWEHQLFFGLGALGLALVGLVRSPSRMRWTALASTAILVALTLDINGYSVYLLLVSLPGIDSIRAVTRISLVMVLPISLLCAMAIDSVHGAARPMRLLTIVLLAVMVGESAAVVVPRARMADARARIAWLKASLPAVIPQGAWLYNPLRPGAPVLETEIDGMILAQETGYPTLNGYSGNIPPGYQRLGLPSCMQALMRLRAAEIFFSNHPESMRPYQPPGEVILPGKAARCPPEPGAPGGGLP